MVVRLLGRQSRIGIRLIRVYFAPMVMSAANLRLQRELRLAHLLMTLASLITFALHSLSMMLLDSDRLRRKAAHEKVFIRIGVLITKLVLLI